VLGFYDNNYEPCEIIFEIGNNEWKLRELEFSGVAGHSDHQPKFIFPQGKEVEGAYMPKIEETLDILRRELENKTDMDTDEVFTNFTDQFGIEMIAVEGGNFWMGAQDTDPNATNYDADAEDDESPVHQVTLSDYFIGKYPVTQAQWKAVMGVNPSRFKGDNLPVEQVSWKEVQEFIHRLNRQTGKNYRLPTEAEWEFAARGGNQSCGYKYSGSNTPDNVAWSFENAGGKTHPVGTKQANELGIYDMSGNVFELCNDWYDDYSSGSQINPIGANSDSERVLRGGAKQSLARLGRVSNRHHSSIRRDDYGFRLACDVK
jgi:formylglycine-generating enzyme required for sulfatase activity